MVAYLILAHNQPAQLLRMVNRLNADGVTFYIHVDTKCTAVDTIRQQFAGMPNVQVISRYSVNWMGFNMIQASLDLMSLAASGATPPKYYVLMSGQDYPIKPNSYILDFFERNHHDFISYNLIEYMPLNFKEKMWFHHYMDVPAWNPRNPKKNPLLHRLYFMVHNRLRKVLPHRKFYQGWEPVFGSQWFALTHHTVRYILDYVAQNPAYSAFMRTTEGPDETFFHTLIYNSPRRANLYDIDKFDAWLKNRKEGVFQAGYSSLRYMDWSERAKTKPAVLDMTYYTDLATNPNLFARKLDEKQSAELLDKLDRELLNVKS